MKFSIAIILTLPAFSLASITQSNFFGFNKTECSGEPLTFTRVLGNCTEVECTAGFEVECHSAMTEGLPVGNYVVAYQFTDNECNKSADDTITAITGYNTGQCQKLGEGQYVLAECSDEATVKMCSDEACETCNETTTQNVGTCQENVLLECTSAATKIQNILVPIMVVMSTLFLTSV